MDILNEKASIEGIEKGVITSSIENTWTREDALYEIADNKTDVFATKIKFAKGFDVDKNKFYLEVFHNGDKFESIKDFWDFNVQFTYHNTHGRNGTISLKGVGRRYAMYVLLGYANWDDDVTSE